MEQENTEKKEKNKKITLEKIHEDKIRGRMLIINPEKSEFAQKLGLKKRGDYVQKQKWTS